MRLQSSYQLRLPSSEGSTGAGSTSPLIHVIIGRPQLLVDYWLENSVSYHGDLSVSCLTVFTMCKLAVLRVSDDREREMREREKERENPRWRLQSAMFQKWHAIPFCHILLGTHTDPCITWQGLQKGVNAKRWGSWGLAAIHFTGTNTVWF